MNTIKNSQDCWVIWQVKSLFYTVEIRPKLMLFPNNGPMWHHQVKNGVTTSQFPIWITFFTYWINCDTDVSQSLEKFVNLSISCLVLIESSISFSKFLHILRSCSWLSVYFELVIIQSVLLSRVLCIASLTHLFIYQIFIDGLLFVRSSYMWDIGLVLGETIG